MYQKRFGMDLLKSNEITFTRLAKDTLIEVESYKIADYKTSSALYEGHYIHRDTKLVSKMEKLAFAKGDYVVETRQKELISETLEPEGIDSFSIGIFSIRCYSKRRLLKLCF
jgi:UPF0288 family protein (methanogenesis marker protein 3)